MKEQVVKPLAETLDLGTETHSAIQITVNEHFIRYDVEWRRVVHLYIQSLVTNTYTLKRIKASRTFKVSLHQGVS